jgi:hypothetical protein
VSQRNRSCRPEFGTYRERAADRGLILSVACLQAVVDEIRRMLDPGKPSFTPSKGKPNVVMFVGLQGQWLSIIHLPSCSLHLIHSNICIGSLELTVENACLRSVFISERLG